MTLQAEQLMGAQVTGSDGQPVGIVDEVFRDDVAGTPSWVRVRSGGQQHLVPLGGSIVTTRGLSVPFDARKIADEPVLDVDMHLSAAQEEQLRGYFGIGLPRDSAETEWTPARWAEQLQPDESQLRDVQPGETWWDEAPTADAPWGDVLSGEAPTGQARWGDVLSGEAPTGQARWGEAQLGEAPMPGEAPAGEVPSGEAPTAGARWGEVSSAEVSSAAGQLADAEPGGLRWGEGRPGEARWDDVRPGDAQPGEAQLGEARWGEGRPGELRWDDVRPGEVRPGEARWSETLPGEALPGEALPGEARWSEVSPGGAPAGEARWREVRPGEARWSEVSPGGAPAGEARWREVRPGEARWGEAQADWAGQPGSNHATVITGRPGVPSPADHGWLILTEERLEVETEVVESGRVRLHRYVDTEPIERVVHVFHEEYEIEHIPIAPGEPVSDGPNDGDQELILHEKRAFFVKRTVPVERVRLAARRVDEDKTFRGEIRRERIEIETEAARLGTERSGI